MLPPVPGADLPHVATVWQVLQGEKTAEPGENILILIKLASIRPPVSPICWLSEAAMLKSFTGQFYVGGDLGITLDIKLWYRTFLAKGVRLTANHS